MIEDSNNDAASDLSGDDGEPTAWPRQTPRWASTHTTPGTDYDWGLTTTTVSDQLRLLEDLTWPRSPLDRASRSLELDLMADVTADQAWGVSAAATPHTSFAVKNGWLPDPQLGDQQHRGHRACPSAAAGGGALRRSPFEVVGIAQVEAVARAAVEAVSGTS